MRNDSASYIWWIIFQSNKLKLCYSVDIQNWIRQLQNIIIELFGLSANRTNDSGILWNELIIIMKMVLHKQAESEHGLFKKKKNHTYSTMWINQNRTKYFRFGSNSLKLLRHQWNDSNVINHWTGIHFISDK